MLKTLEELFLKIFKVVVIVTMGLLLIATVIGGGYALIKAASQVQEPAPAKVPPKKEITPDDFLKHLNPVPKPEKPSAEPDRSDTVPSTKVLLYQEQAKKIYECASSIASKAGIIVDPVSNAEIANQIEFLRGELARVAREKVEGDEKDETAWVDAASTFICLLSNSPAVIEARKSGKINSIVIPGLNFHLSAWEAAKKSQAEFEAKEAKRVARELNAEENRVAADKALAMVVGMIAGGCFLAFMALALYLLFAKVETNLREIGKAIINK